jgi:hypothetical protein
MEGKGLQLDVEVEMVKAALLYADHVTLASPKALFAFSAAGLAYGDRESRVDATLGILQATQDAPFADLYKELKTKPHRTHAELQILARLESAVTRASDGMREGLDPVLENSRLEELVPAIEAGLLDVDALGADRIDADADDFLDQVFESLLARLRSSMSSSATAHPLYDDSAGGLLRAMLQEGAIEDPAVELANEMGVARGLIATVEGFPHAPMDVVLDVRDRLQSPLVRFRAAVAAASRELGEGDSVLTAGFQARVAEIYRRTVAPELQTIEESLQEMKALPTHRRAAPTIAQSGARAAVSAGLALLTGALDDVDLAALAMFAGAGAKAAADERSHRAQEARARKQNRFFWLYEADRQLGS